MQAEVLIYSSAISNRLRYTFNFVFNEFLGLNYILTTDVTKFISYGGCKINYSKEKLNSDLTIIPSGLLFKTGIIIQDFKITQYKNTPIFYQTNISATLPYDLFSCVFFMISRYEEYLPSIKDKHNRFDAYKSFAFQHHFLRKAVVDRWILQLKEELQLKYFSLPIKEKKFSYLSTIDIDNAYAYAHKGLIRSTFSILRDIIKLNFTEVFKRFKVLFHIEPDEFDTYEYLHEQHKKLKNKALYFFLVGKYGQYDTNLNIQNKSFQSLIKSIADKAHIGVHPSYKSNEVLRYLLREKNNLEKITHAEVVKSRQHFLKLNLPNTYRNLLQVDIQEDYTMGFAQEPGFRAGTCTPFYFYDLDTEQETKLKIFPMHIMDGTLLDYMKLSVNQAQEVIKEIVEEVKNVNGLLITIWHNESLSNANRWKGWKTVFEKIIELATK